MSEDKLSKLKTQVEYYFSEKNLAMDEFFHEKLKSSEDNSLDIESLLKCNKVIKLGASKDDILNCITESDIVLLNEGKTGIKRKSNEPLPELKLRKKRKLNDGDDKNDEEEINADFQDFEPLIFTCSTEEEKIVNWKEIQEILQKEHSLKAPYARFAKNEGNFAVNKKTVTQEQIDKLEEGLIVEKGVVKVFVAKDEDLETFWEKHGRHYEGIKERKEKDAKKEKNKGKRGGSSQKKSIKKQITFANETYKDIVDLKNVFKGVLSRTPNNEAIKEPYHAMLQELLTHHDKGEEKVKGMQNFTVGVHPEYKDTRCFFVVKENDVKEDFSSVKCLKNFEDKLAE